jgi:hypothetical protein
MDPIPHHPLSDHGRSDLLTRLNASLTDVFLEGGELLRVELGDGRGGLTRLRGEGLRGTLLGARRHGLSRGRCLGMKERGLRSEGRTGRGKEEKEKRVSSEERDKDDGLLVASSSA